MKNNLKTEKQKNYQQNVIRATVSSNVGINNNERLKKTYGALSHRIELINQIQKHSLFTRCWFAVFYLLGIVCLFLDFKGAWFNVLDLFLVMINAYLIARNKISGMYLAILENLFYAFIAFKSQLFGEVAKSLLISIPLYIYSIISWKKASIRNKEREVIIKKLKKKQIILCMFFTIFLAAVCFVFLKFCCNQKNALLLSSLSLALLIIAKVLAANHYMDNYTLYIVYGFIGLGLWIETMAISGFSIAILSMIIYRIALILNDIKGYSLWKLLHRRFIINNKGFLCAMRPIKINKIIKLRRRYKNLRWNKKVDMAKNS